MLYLTKNKRNIWNYFILGKSKKDGLGMESREDVECAMECNEDISAES